MSEQEKEAITAELFLQELREGRKDFSNITIQKRAHLIGADLSGADLSGADLSGAGLHRTILPDSTILG